MNRRQLQVVVASASVALAGLLALQVYWFRQAFSVEQRQFEEKVNLTLRAVAHGLLLVQQDSASFIQPITQTASNAFYVQLHTQVTYASLDSLLTIQLQAQGLDMPYQLALYNSRGNTLLAGYYSVSPLAPTVRSPLPLTVNSSLPPAVKPCLTRNPEKIYADFSITFPSHTRHIAGQLGIWITTAFIFLIVLLIFAYMVLLMLRQKRLSEMKADFINNMTHELKTPITNLALASEGLCQTAIRNDPVRMLKYTEVIRLESERLGAQVDRVLQLASLEKGEIKLELTKVDIHALLETITHTVRLTVQQRNGQLLTHLHAREATILADKLHLSNLLYSLLDNAQKYSRDTPEITVTTRNQGNGLLIAVADKGVGMDRKTQQLIFDNFYRAPTGDVHQVKGFGLGLSYARAIVKAHKGSIRVESAPQQGSIFEVFFQHV
jgi:two-component system phosphate regulon sensor histidine kinase PhoR